MGIYVSTFFVTFLSGFLPFVNAEAYLVSVSALAPGATLAAVVAAAALVFVSALAGIPPFYVVTLAAGALGFPLGRFFAAGTLGRLLRFAAVFLLPRLF